MSTSIIQLIVYMAVLFALVKPLGSYMARVYEGKNLVLSHVFGPLERLVYRICRVNPVEEMGWKSYATAVILFNIIGIFAVYALQRLQGILPLNTSNLPGVAPDLAFNTAVSFATNTNWQSYSGEITLSYLTQMLGLCVQNFVSAATGMAVLVALIRGFVRHNVMTIGNFWADIVRSTLYILIPLSIVLAVVLVSQGVVQSFGHAKTVSLVQPIKDQTGEFITQQVLPMGPAASQVAIKQLGTNGGGFFNVNASHPFENPTPLANFLELLAILLIPASLCYTFGRMVKDTRQGWALLLAMTLIFLPLIFFGLKAEQAGNPILSKMGVDQTASLIQPGGNMEGKEARFGIASSVLWAGATTAASNGSVNSMHDSFTPLGGIVPMVLMQLGEVVYGGVGSGLYGMIVFAIITVFLAGLMVGRTPEYLGKKIESFEIKMAMLVILIPPILVLLGTALAVVTKAGQSAISNPGPHGFSEVLYSFSSAGNNNGSAFAGLSSNNLFYNIALGICMFIARYWLIIPVLAMAGSLAIKKSVPESSGTLSTKTPLFVFFLVAVVIIVGALTFIPALALGPVVEHLMR